MVRIPPEYQEVEYLESTGTQWIKTDIEGRFSASFESEIIFTGNQDSYSVGFKDGTFQLSGNGCYGVRTQIGYASSYSNGPSESLRLLKRYKYKTIFEPGNQEVYLDDVLVNTSAFAKNADTLTGVHFGIFARLNNDSSASLFSKVKMYYLKISDNGELLGHFIPCYRKSDSKPGMYDTVSGEFYVNSGTGEFLVGNDVSWEAIDLLALRRMVMFSMASGAWKQKRVTVQNAIALGDGFANLIANNIPSGVTFALIVKDNLDPNTFINNQLVYGAYDTANPGNNMFSRYRSSSYIQIGGGSGTWSNTYALTASAGDLYSIFYQA